MSIFRSEKMSLWQLFIQNESAYQCLAELGELGIVQFRDLNPDMTAFQRNFTQEVRRCDNMERKLRFLEAQITKEDLVIDEVENFPMAPEPREIVDLEAALDKLEGELREVNANYEVLRKNQLELTELKYILMQSQPYLDARSNLLDQGPSDSYKSDGEEVLNNPQTAFQKFRFVAGVIEAERVPGFERMLFRAGRGNIYFRHEPIQTVLKDPATDEELRKVVFVCFYQGEQLRSRVKKICDGYHASLYPCPEGAAQRREMVVGIASRLEDLNSVLNQTREHRHRVLLAASKNLHNWFIKVRKIKAIYHTMNLLSTDVTRKFLIAECWIPSSDVERVRQTLTQTSEKCQATFPPVLNIMQTEEKHPTYFRTNKFTKGFQAVVNAYGLANYREVNPGLFTIATFPFLFAVMFGDAGHGIILSMFALWMVLKENSLKKIKGEVWGIFFGGRYIILMMGLFSIYTGVVYNDIFSRSMNIFGPSWKVNYDTDMIFGHVDENGVHHEGMESGMLIPEPHKPCSDDNTSAAYHLECGGHYRGDPYWFGLDPAWQVAENKIVYQNSYKMKLSIIFGVLQMSFGIFLNLWNYTYFKRYSAIFVEFLPRLLFFWPLFGYLVFLMFYKWVFYGGTFDARPQQSDCAPSILISFINMMLFQYTEDKTTPPVPSCETVFFFEGQQTLQVIFVIVAILSVPVLLFGTPIIFSIKSKRKQRLRESYSDSNSHQGKNVDEDQSSDEIPIVRTPHTDEEHEETFGDVMIHQAIHTIEYVLECISHTASYLRLWALSLAHAQLSEVLWSMVLDIGLANGTWVGGPIIFAVFAVWATFTVGILIAMEGMSAFLHTLRLHWVEFQSKFYVGEGIAFRPFSFKHVGESSNDENA